MPLQPTLPQFVVSAIDQERGTITISRGDELTMPHAITSDTIAPDDAADIFEHFAKRGIAPPVSAWNQLAGDARVIGRMLGELRSYDEELEHVRELLQKRNDVVDRANATIRSLQGDLDRARMPTVIESWKKHPRTFEQVRAEYTQAQRSAYGTSDGWVKLSVDERKQASDAWSAELRAKVQAAADERKRHEVSVVCDVEWD